MKGILDFLSAALPWISIGLLLAIFLRRAPERKTETKRMRITVPKEWLSECASVRRLLPLSAIIRESDLRWECWQGWSSVPALKKRKTVTKNECMMNDIRTEHITRLTKEGWKAGFTV